MFVRQLFAQLARRKVADAVIGTHLVAEEPRARAVVVVVVVVVAVVVGTRY